MKFNIKLLLYKFFILLSICSIFSCKIFSDIACGISIEKANKLFNKGYMHEAISIYLKSPQTQSAEISYNIANVFSTLEEDNSAEQMWSNAIALSQKSETNKAEWCSFFNSGVKYFNNNQFNSAAAAFKKAIIAHSKYSQEIFDKKPTQADTQIRDELARMYELAIICSQKNKAANTNERAHFIQGTGGSLEAFSISRPDEKSIFVLGNTSTDMENDH